MRRTAHHFFSTRGKALPLSTLLLAALCVLLTAPAAQATSREDVRAAILTQVLTASATSSQLSALETRQVRVLLSRLEKSDSGLSLSQIQSELQSTLDALNTQSTPVAQISLRLFWKESLPPHLLTPHLAAQLSGTRTNSYLE